MAKGFSEKPAWEKACTPAKSNSAGTFSENAAWNNACILCTDIDLATLQPLQGIKITREAANDSSGYSVSSAGDVNGDGIDDFLIGAYVVDNYKGKSYIIYGSNDLEDIDLPPDSGKGITITGTVDSGASGYSVSDVGDVNGDGIDDFLIGAYNAYTSKGESYLIYGRQRPEDIDLPLRLERALQ